MFLKEFNQTPTKKLGKINKLLNEQFGIKMSNHAFPSKSKLLKLRETANNAIIQLRNNNKRFQLEPDYAKFLGLRDMTDVMLSEGMYAESPAYQSLKTMVKDVVRELMDKGYSDDEASKECMNRYRMDPRFAYDDEVVLPMVINAAKEYVDECSMSNEAIESAVVDNDLSLNEKLMKALALECGVKLEDVGSIDAIAEKLDMFANVAGRSRDAVVGFLNGLDEDAIQGGIQMFGKKVAEQNRFNKARKDAIAAGEKSFTVGGTEYPITGNALEEGTFDSIIDSIINEGVDVEQAEVVIAVRALADDIQDMVERMGRMVNEDIPAIADQMRAEMGATQAQSFVDSVSSGINQHMEATRQIKATIDQQVGVLTGEESAAPMDAGMGEMPAEDPMGGMDAGMDAGMGEMPAEEPAAAAEEDPMGRAAI